MIQDQLRETIVAAIKKVFSIELKKSEVKIEHPENEAFGDFSSNVVFLLTNKLKGRTMDLAENIVAQLKEMKIENYFEGMEVRTPGFINFFLKQEFLFKELQKVDKDYGQGGDLKGKKILVEFAHPNTHKQFHIGHLRNISLAESIIRLLETQGAKIIRANYQGDVGLHIAKALWGIKNSKIDWKKLKSLEEKVQFLGKVYASGSQAYEKNPEAKKEILEINKKIYSQKDKEINQLWKETRQWSLDYFETIYKRVYSHFDRYYFECEVYQKGKEWVLKGLKKGIFKKSKGAIIFPGSQYGPPKGEASLHDRVFVTGEGNPTYEAKDMELGRLQFAEYNPDLVMHIVGPEQASYFQVVFKALEKLFPQTKGKKYHLSYGWVKLKEGKMSSRSGKVVTGPWLLDEAKKRIKKAYPDLDEKTAEMIAVAAVKYSFLKVNPQTEVAFDFDESISLSGNSGPYLQYTYARCQSVLNKAKKNLELRVKNYELIKNLELNNEEKAILRTFYKFPEVVQLSTKTYTPNLLCNFLYDLGQKYNAFYNKHRILGNNQQLVASRDFRLLLTSVTARILNSGLNLLAIKTPEKM